MTRIAALYDIHGNLPALEAVVPDLDADVVVVGGDIASGPFPVETLALLRSLPVPVRLVRGNADRILDLEGIPEPNRSARLWVAERLREEESASSRVSRRASSSTAFASATEPRAATRS